ncbi:hypothetical protein [Streptomyces sp. MNP-20]|uniref:hypothetical protein n=1 Tax=Streptomyces sp. MNP-20 TaxID=2721165 RepID=UPI001556359C|nr:hypothetical protein [Streptomyces sp. MNP-20]
MTTADVFQFDVRAESDFGHADDFDAQLQLTYANVDVTELTSPGQVVEISLVVDARPGS